MNRLPRLLDVVFWSYIGTAGLNVVVGAWAVSFVPGAIDELHAQGRTVAPLGVFLAFALIVAGTLGYSTAIVLLAIRLRRGSRWARPALLTVSLLSLLGIVTGGSPGIAVVVLLAIIGFLATRREISLWLAERRGLPSA